MNNILSKIVKTNQVILKLLRLIRSN